MGAATSGLGFKDIAPVTENQMNKNGTRNIYWGYIGSTGVISCMTLSISYLGNYGIMVC